MKIKFLGLMIAGMMLAAAPVQAAVLSVLGGTPGVTIASVTDSPFDGVGTGLTETSLVTHFPAGSTPNFGLFLSEAANITFEFLGKEAVFLNTFNVGANTFKNGTTAPGTSFNYDLSAGALPFYFTSLGAGKLAINNVLIQTPLAFAIAVLDDTSVILLFDDGALGIDLDDMAVKVSVSQVPLPATAWLLISAVLGLVTFSRIRRGGTQTV